MYVVGIDENGLGPRLGPLVATAITLEVGRYDAAKLRRRGLGLGITDSKQSSGFGRMAFAEGLALALVARLAGEAPRDADGLLEALSLDSPLELRSPCPDSSTARQCFGEALTLPAYGGDVEAGREALARLEGRGTLRIVRARTALRCVGTLNSELRAGTSKLAVDLHLFERLLLDARSGARADVEAYAGMIGGIRDYPKFARHVPAAAYRDAELVRGRLSYRVDGVGAIRFEVDADATHLPVALASMVGKYVREVTMDRIARFYRSIDPGLPAPSGYHDKVTARFVDGTEPHRRRLRIANACFLREG